MGEGAEQSLHERIEAQRDRVIQALEAKDDLKGERDRAAKQLELAEEATKRAEQNLKDARRDGSDQRIANAEKRLADKKRAQEEAREDLQAADGKLEEAQKRQDEVRDRLMELKDTRDERRKKQREKLSTDSGAPGWGGAEVIIEREVIPAVKAIRPNVQRTSGKRTETFGNPGSDHHVSQTRASAADFNLTEDGDARNAVSRRLADRACADFEAVFFDYEGHEYRLQGIAQTHGTGPHLHEGIELVG